MVSSQIFTSKTERVPSITFKMKNVTGFSIFFIAILLTNNVKFITMFPLSNILGNILAIKRDNVSESTTAVPWNNLCKFNYIHYYLK